MDEIKVVAFDLDGTLLRHEGHIAPLNRQVIAELAQRGLKIVVATGRNPPLVRDVDIPAEVSLVVCANGSSAYTHPEWELIERSFIFPELVAAIIARFRACHYHLHAYYATDRLVYEYMNAELGQRYAGPLLRIKKERVNYDDLDQQQFVKFISYGEPNDLEPILAPLRRQFGELLYANYSLPGVMEMMSATVSKGEALSRLLPQCYGFGMQQTLAIGDGFNDLGMLNAAGVGVVMGNAHEQMRKHAHERRFYAAGTNSEDGAAHFLRAWFKLP